MSQKMKILAFSAAVILLLALLLGLQALRGENELAVFVTGGAEGYLLPCGCRTSPAGGLSRRVTLIDDARRENPGRRVVPVELSPLFMDRGPAKDVINTAFGDFLKSENYLVSAGPRDLELGNKLKEYYKGEYHLAGMAGYRDDVVVELGGYRYLPFGKKGKLRLLFISETALLGKKLDDPLEVFRKKVREAPQDTYIVLGNLSTMKIQEMVKEKADLLAIVSVWGHMVTTLPQKADDTWVVFLGDRGRRYALLEIGYFDGRWEIWPKCEYIHRSLEGDAKVEERVRETMKKAEEINLSELEKSVVKPAGPSFNGSDHCGGCHAKEYDIWKKTGHGSALATLEIDHQQNNTECLPCHVTGFRGGGYPAMKESLSGVGCESCHGPGEGHPPERHAPAEEAAGACLKCHTKRDSPNFDREMYMKMIDHWSRN
ncbi:MAG TPA: multiheme c-type cytochrome [Acidobacteriota bacterium]|nr:multiheme c-type cytochrome [Acidobacteriota bacterium]HNT16296.1 multiheme c-type cytochrome [Acidobacteriota bacterium]HQO18836.1 multiheme c-type cytochrome [Acidobacteriota bacterium]HQQ47221.1 multiheme c-type cytochrome [Acidobacteriota bacterium]